MSITLTLLFFKYSVQVKISIAMLVHRSRHIIVKLMLWKYFVPLQLVPFPLNPLLHVHWKDPPMLLHVALLWHGETTAEHSSISRVFSQICKEFFQNYEWVVIQETITKYCYYNNTINSLIIFVYFCTGAHCSISWKSIVTCTLKRSISIVACCITVTWWNNQRAFVYIYSI